MPTVTSPRHNDRVGSGQIDPPAGSPVAVVDDDTDLTRARLLHAQGVLENNAGHPRRALQTFRRAMRRIGADVEPTDADALEPERAELAARLWISAAMSESELNGLDRGLAVIATAQRFLSRRPSPAVAVHLYGQLGAMNIRAGRLDEALTSLDSAVELLEHTEPAETCKILMNRGSLRLYRGDLARAREDLTRSADHAHAHRLPDDECKARHNLGYAEFLAGNLALALRIMDEALTLSNDVSMGIILLDRARVLFEAGLHREADDGLTEAAGLFASERLWQDVGEVELARAECALLDGETQAARRFAGRARDRFRRRGNDRWRREALLVLLQADLAQGRPGLRLAGPARRLAAEFRADGLTARARTAELLAAEALLRAGRLDEARWVAAEAGAVRPEDSVSTRLHTRLVRARLAVAAQDAAVARREIRTGLSELATHQAQFGSLDLQTASAVHGRQLAELDLSQALAENRPAAVLAAIERGRATSNRLPSVSAPSDPVTAELLAELRGILEGLRAIESDPSAAAVVADQRHRIAAIERDLRARSWQSEGGGIAGRPSTLAEIEARLVDRDSVLVCYFEVAGRLQAMVLGRGGPRSWLWPRRSRCTNRRAGYGPTSTCWPPATCRARWWTQCTPRWPVPWTGWTTRSSPRCGSATSGWSSCPPGYSACCRGPACRPCPDAPWSWRRPRRRGFRPRPASGELRRGWWRWPVRTSTAPTTRSRRSDPAGPTPRCSPARVRAGPTWPRRWPRPRWSTSPRTASIRRRTRCSPRSGWPTARCSHGSWTVALGRPSTWCCRPVSSARRPCAPATRRWV